MGKQGRMDHRKRKFVPDGSQVRYTYHAYSVLYVLYISSSVDVLGVSAIEWAWPLIKWAPNGMRSRILSGAENILYIYIYISFSRRRVGEVSHWLANHLSLTRGRGEKRAFRKVFIYLFIFFSDKRQSNYTRNFGRKTQPARKKLKVRFQQSDPLLLINQYMISYR